MPNRRYWAWLLMAAFALMPQSPLLSASPSRTKQESKRVTASEDKPPAYVPTKAYRIRKIRGWKVYVNRLLLADRADLGRPALELLDSKLLDVCRAVPPRALANLQEVPLWLGVNDGHAPCAEYHPNRDWLLEHGYNPDKARCVEIGNAQRFLEWSVDQPWMVLHELAHAYQDRFLGEERSEIIAAYEAVKRGGKYESVLHINGKRQRAYALTNMEEFFAESSEAYFGTNDFYPFVRAELQDYDPETFALLKRLWNR